MMQPKQEKVSNRTKGILFPFQMVFSFLIGHIPASLCCQFLPNMLMRFNFLKRLWPCIATYQLPTGGETFLPKCTKESSIVCAFICYRGKASYIDNNTLLIQRSFYFLSMKVEQPRISFVAA